MVQVFAFVLPLVSVLALADCLFLCFVRKYKQLRLLML